MYKTDKSTALALSLTACRSFGVLLWEIVSYGRTPLDDAAMEDIVNAAQDGTLHHARSELMIVYYIILY